MDKINRLVIEMNERLARDEDRRVADRDAIAKHDAAVLEKVAAATRRIMSEVRRDGQY